MLDLGDDEDIGQSSYLVTQGNTSAPSRKRGKSKSSNDGGERRRKKGAAAGGGVQMSQGLGPQDYALNIPSGSGVSSSGALDETSMDNQHGRTPKLVFKKGGRKGNDKGAVSMEQANHEQKAADAEARLFGHVWSRKIWMVSASSKPPVDPNKEVPAAIMMMPCSF